MMYEGDKGWRKVSLTPRAYEIISHWSDDLSRKHGRRVTLSEAVERVADQVDAWEDLRDRARQTMTEYGVAQFKANLAKLDEDSQ